MAGRLIQSETLQGIANAIRSKDGTSANINVADFAQRITDIPSSGSYFGSDFPILDGDTHLWVDIFYLDNFTINGTVNSEITVNWGDGTTETISSGSVSHTYSTIGKYRIDIKGGGFTFKSDTTGGNQPTMFRRTVQLIEIGSNIGRSANRSIFAGLSKIKEICFNIGSGNSFSLSYETVKGNASLEKISIKSGNITYGYGSANIGSYECFYNCTSLKDIDLANANITNTIGQNSFAWCGSLREIDLRNKGVKTLGSKAFDSCSILKTVYLPDTITSITNNAFNSVSSLTDIYVPWAEGTIANAPWGATNATIHYNYTGGN